MDGVAKGFLLFQGLVCIVDCIVLDEDDSKEGASS